MKVAVIGSNGQLGTDICNEFQKTNAELFKLTENDIEISNLQGVFTVFDKIKPDVIINTAAYHNVEKCEQNLIRAFEVNAIGARNLANASLRHNAYLIHISTDYVFDGFKKKPYVETDRPVPLNVYGNTKLSGEHFIESIANRYVILRTSGLYGHSPCLAKGGLNFVNLMLKLSKERNEIRVVNNEILTPTSTVELARQIVKIHQSDLHGLVHATAEGQCSWYEFAREIFRLKNITTTLNIAEPNEFPSKVPRPLYSVLENKNLKSVNLNIFKPWQEGLKEYLQTDK